VKQDPQTSFEMDVKPRPVLHDITVLIPTIGRPILEACLWSIATGHAWPARIIVVDQSSSPVIAAWVDRLRCLGISAEHVPSSQRGKGAAVNRGIEKVTTRFLAQTDDDCFVEPDWLQNIVARLRESPQTIVTGRMEPEGDEPVVTLQRSRKSVILRHPPLTQDFSFNAILGIATAVIERIGLLDEDLWPAEDLEYSYRALRSGVNIVYAPEIAVRHFGWRNSAQRADQYRAYARGLGMFYGKYLRQGDWFIALRIPLHLQRSLRKWLRGIITRDEEATFYGQIYMVGLFPGMLSGWRNGRPA
jgi:cellulose synthase/poly-beta-1,6-N-acetylglucosamine synthase-like glycosyltransferase